MNANELCNTLNINHEQLQELLRLGVPRVGRGKTLKFVPELVADWIKQNGYWEPAPNAAPEPFTLRTIGQVAQFFGVSVVTVHQWLKESPPMPGQPGGRGKQEGFFPIHQIREWLQAREQRLANTVNGISERDRLVATRRRLAELELREKRGELLPAAIVGQAFLRAVHQTKTQLDQLPTQLIKLLPRGTDKETQKQFRTKIERTLAGVYQTLADSIAAQAREDQQK
jgi:DNA-binding transcriptional MerR regulator